MRPATLAELADRAGIPAPMPSGYGSFAAFTSTITAAARCLRAPADVVRVIDEIVQDAAASGGVWVELSVWPGLFGGRLGPDAAVVDVMARAVRAASDRHGVGVGLVLAANRDRGPEAALDVARLAVARRDDGVVGFGLDGDEAGYPPVLFDRACAVVREAGLPVLPHAGEFLGAASVADAVDVLGARRIMHGVRCVEDPGLVRRLAREGTVLDICPTSNVLLSVAPSLREHPLPALLAAGVRCTVNADDPLLFGTDLLREYEHCRDQMAVTDHQLARVATTSLRASAAPADLVATAIRGVESWLAAGDSGR